MAYIGLKTRKSNEKNRLTQHVIIIQSQLNFTKTGTPAYGKPYEQRRSHNEIFACSHSV